jgi:hypothetical protein
MDRNENRILSVEEGPHISGHQSKANLFCMRELVCLCGNYALMTKVQDYI